MATVSVVGSSQQADTQPKSVGLVWVFAVTCIYQNEQSELLQWPCHDDSTVNMAFTIINIIIAIIININMETELNNMKCREGFQGWFGEICCFFAAVTCQTVTCRHCMWYIN